MSFQCLLLPFVKHCDSSKWLQQQSLVSPSFSLMMAKRSYHLAMVHVDLILVPNANSRKELVLSSILSLEDLLQCESEKQGWKKALKAGYQQTLITIENDSGDSH
jgi:tRNA A37 threonylcarbamoyladenosine biosynthesis protein TsaE